MKQYLNYIMKVKPINLIIWSLVIYAEIIKN